MSKDLIAQSKIPVAKHRKFFSPNLNDKIQNKINLDETKANNENENENTSENTASIQEKINPDIFKKIFNRHYKKVVFKEEESSTDKEDNNKGFGSKSSLIPKFVASKKLKEFELQNKLIFSSEIKTNEMPISTTILARQNEIRCNIPKLSTSSNSSDSSNNNNNEINKYEVKPTSNKNLLLSKSKENLSTNIRYQSHVASELNNKFKNELDFMLADNNNNLPLPVKTPYKLTNVEIQDNKKQIKKTHDLPEKKSELINLSNQSSDLDISISSTSSSLEYDDFLSEYCKTNNTSSYDATLYANLDSELANIKNKKKIDEDLSSSLSLSSSSSTSKCSSNENLALKFLKDIKKNMKTPEYEKLLLFLKNTADKSCKFYDVSAIIDETFLSSTSYANTEIENFKLKNESTSPTHFSDIAIQVDEVDIDYDLHEEEEEEDVFDKTVNMFQKYKLNSDGNNVIKKTDVKNNSNVSSNGHKKSFKDLLRMDRISESAHENSNSSISSSQNKEELNNLKLSSNFKVFDETLRDAENISDIEEETESNQDEWWMDSSRKTKSIDNEIVKLANDQKISSIMSANSENNNNSGRKSGLAFDARKQFDSEKGKETPNELPNKISTTNEKTNIKSRKYRCDAIVMYDQENNVNFCKLCRLYSFNPPLKMENGQDFGIQVDLNMSQNEEIVLKDSSGYDSSQNKSRESMKFTNFDFEPETDISEIKLNFEYEINDNDSSPNLENRRKLMKHDEELIKQRTRTGLKFWKDEDKKNQHKINESKACETKQRSSPRNESTNGDVKSKISVFESKKTEKQSNSNMKQSIKTNRENVNLNLTNSSNEKEKYTNEINQDIIDPSLNRNSDVHLNEFQSCKNHVNVTDIQAPNDKFRDEDDFEEEEVEVVIDIGNLSRYPSNMLRNFDETTSSTSIDIIPNESLKLIVMNAIPSAGIAYIDEIVYELKVLLQNEILNVRNIDDLPRYIIDYIETRYQTLLNSQFSNHDAALSSTSDMERSFSFNTNPNSNEHTELTIVKNVREHNVDDLQNDTEDDILKVDEETLYIVEKMIKNNNTGFSSNKFNDIDTEVRKNFKLKSKDSFDDIINNNLTSTIGHSVNDKFSADALYDLNKQVVHRNELQKLNEQYNIFRSMLIIMLDGTKKPQNFPINNNSDYQLHFLHSYEKNKAYFQNILLISFDKGSSDHFNADKESEHTQMSVFLLRKRFNEASNRPNNVIARINVVYIDEKNLSMYSKFSLISLNEIENRLNENMKPINRHFVHVRYFKCSTDMNIDERTEIRESIIDINILPYQLRIEILNECERYQMNLPNKKTFNVEMNIRYENDNLIMPTLAVLVLESDIIQNAINKKRDELISTTLTAHSDKLNDKIVELDSFIKAIEQELNSYLICEKVVDRDTDLTDTKHLVKLNKLDALVSFEIVQSFKTLFEKMKDFCIFYDPDDSTVQRLNKSKNEFYIMDDGSYYKCVIPIEYINEEIKNNGELFESINQSSTLVIETMNKRQNYIFGKHLKSAFPLDNKQNENEITDIKSIRLKQPKTRQTTAALIKNTQKPDSSTDTDLNKISSYSDADNTQSLTLASSVKPDAKYCVKIDYDKKEVTKEEIETQCEFLAHPKSENTNISKLCEFGVQVNDEEKMKEKKLIEVLINENNFLKEQVNKSNIKKDACCETDNLKDKKDSYDMILDRSSYINESKGFKMNKVKIDDFNVNEEFPVMEYETINNENYIQFDETDIEMMQKKLIRDDIIINQIDKMFHSIRDHQGANEKTKAQDHIRRRSSSWSYSSNRRHVRAKVMELSFFDKERKQQDKQNSRNTSDENIFLRIDDYLSQKNSRALVRSYSADYLNENAAPRTRIKYLRIPGDIMKTEVITHYQYNIVPSEYRTIPYGLRYWSILKLLQEERESGQPYIYLGDAYLGQPPDEWIHTDSILKDILKNGGNVDPALILSNSLEVYKKHQDAENIEIEAFMSTSNLDKEIQMVKSSEQLLRNMSEAPCNDMKSKKHNFITPIVVSEKVTTYEQLPDRIISAVEKIEYDSKRNVNRGVKVPIYNKNINYKEVNDHQGINKYPLLDDIISVAEKSIASSNKVNNNLIMQDIKHATAQSADMYGHYYPNYEPSESESRFIDLESIISKKIDDTNNYLKALSADNLINEPAKTSISKKININEKYHEFQPKVKIPHRSMSKSLKSLNDMTTYERTISVPSSTGKHAYNSYESEYVEFEADETQIGDILSGKYNFENSTPKQKQNDNQMINLKRIYNHQTMMNH